MRQTRTRILSLLLTLVMCLGLLPGVALAAEEDADPGMAAAAETSYTITFDANGGQFPDGSTTMAVQTKWLGAGNNITTTPPDPTREGYIFNGWDIDFVWNHDFTADTTVLAKWKMEESNRRMTFPLDANGGTVSPDTITLDENWMIIGKLPTPTRPGYTFKGWYLDDKLVDGSKPLITTAPFLKAQWERSSKITPSISASPSKIEAGAEKVEVTLFCSTSGAMLDWRPFERILYGGSRPADVESAVRNCINRNNPNGPSGLKLTDIRCGSGYSDLDDSAYPPALYPEGVYPTSQLVLTFEGKAVAGQDLYIYLEPGCFVQPVSKSEHLVLTEASAQIFSGTKLSIPITRTAASTPNGPFTVKFNLNCKSPKASEIPKEQKIAKGGTVALPDGSKLTPPDATCEFYAWCTLGEDNKLHPWSEFNAVTADMTLYAGWVPKGTVVKSDEAASTGNTTDTSSTVTPSTVVKRPPTATAASSFTDVAATSPFATAISWAVDLGITNGTTLTTFSPGSTCTRGHILTFLWRSQGSPEPTIANPYQDEIPDAFQKATIWAHEKGLVTGDSFGSAVPCTRASAVTYMWKLAGSPEAKAASFKDVAASSDYAKAVSWAVAQGVTNGTGDGSTFSPDTTCTRGQIVTFLYRAYE